jgi:hypothetical protein
VLRLSPDCGATMRKMTEAILRLIRTLIAPPDYKRYDPPYPGDGI